MLKDYPDNSLIILKEMRSLFRRYSKNIQTTKSIATELDQDYPDNSKSFVMAMFKDYADNS